LDLWKAADAAIDVERSGDCDHRFIEGFERGDGNTLVVLVGS
jgi:hypothetical protein